jgi:hypothetical protein
MCFDFHCSGHNKLSLHGRGKTWVRSDIERLLRKLTIEEFLMEDLVVTRDDITCAYIKIGAKGEDLISGKYKVQLNGNWNTINTCSCVNFILGSALSNFLTLFYYYIYTVMYLSDYRWNLDW